MRFDLHIHTVYSKYSFWKFESSIRPRDLIKKALERKLDGIAITDHDTTKGIVTCLKENKSLGKKVQIIPGCEISSQEGHILALGIKEWNQKKHLPAIEVVEKIKDLGGISIAAHPYCINLIKKGVHDLVNEMKLDGIEVLNFNNFKELNRKAVIAASKLKLGKTAGSDAHMIFDVGKVATISDGDIIDSILKKRTRTSGAEASVLRMVGGNIYRLFFNLKA